MKSSESEQYLTRGPRPCRGRAKRRRYLALLWVATFGITGAVRGAVTWTGEGTDTSWMASGNWSDDSGSTIVPLAGDALLFTGAEGLNNFNNFAVDTAFTGISFDSNAGSFVISGNELLDTGFENESANLQTIDLNLAYDAPNQIQTGADGGDIVLNGNLSGSASSFAKTGPGVLTLAGNNTIGSGNGTFTVAAGTLRLTSSASFTNYPIHLAPGTLSSEYGATLDLRSDSPITAPNSQVVIDDGEGFASINVDRAVGGSGVDQTHSIGSLTVGVAGSTNAPGVLFTNGDGYGLSVGTVTLQGAAWFLGNNMSGGLLRLGTINLNSSQGLTLASWGSGNTSLSGPIIGTGLIYLSGNVSLDDSNVVSSGTLTTGANLSESADNAISGSTYLVIGSGTASLSHSNSYTGGTQFLYGGTALLGNNQALGSGTINLFNGILVSSGAPRTINNPIDLTGGGTLAGTLDITLAGNITVAGNPNQGCYITNNLPSANTATLSGNIYLSPSANSGSYLVVAGTGNTVITGQISNAASVGPGTGSLIVGGTGTISMLSSNSYTGGTIVGGATLLLGAEDAISNGLVSLVGNGKLAESAPGALSGSASINAYEASAFLSQPNDYTGGTTIASGTLTVSNTQGSATGSGSVNINGGTLTGSGRIGGDVSISTLSTLAPGPAGGIGTLTTGPLSMASGTNLIIALNSNAVTCDQLASTASVSLSSPQLTVKDLGSGVVPAGVAFPIVNAAGGVTGTFLGEYEGALIPAGASQFRISYATPDEVVLTSLALATWSGSGGDTNWTTGANWAGGAAPASGSVLTFTGSGGSTNYNNFPDNTAFAGVEFDAYARSFTLNGNAIQDAAIINNSQCAQTINTNLNYTAGNAIEANSDVNINGNLTGSAGFLIKGGPGVLTLSGNNTIGSSSGSLSVLAGTLRLTSSASFTNFQLHFTPGRNTRATNLQLWSDAAIAAPAAQIFADTGGGSIGIDVDHAAGGSGSRQTDEIGSLTVGADNGQTVQFYNGNGYGLNVGTVTLTATQNSLINNLSGGGALTIGALNVGAQSSIATLGGPGKTTINGTISGSGTLAVDGPGVVFINGNTVIPVVANAGELGGVGTIAGRVLVNAGASLAPGSGQVPGTLTTGQLSLADGSNFSISLDSDTRMCDELVSNDSVSLGTSDFASLSLTDVGSTPLAPGAQFTIISAAGGVTGIFAGLPDGSLISAGDNQYSVTYATPGDVLLTVVPEPGCMYLLALSAMLLRRFRRIKSDAHR